MYKELYELVLKEHRRVFEEQPEEDLEALMDAVMSAERIFVFEQAGKGSRRAALPCGSCTLEKRPSGFWMIRRRE